MCRESVEAQSNDKRNLTCGDLELSLEIKDLISLFFSLECFNCQWVSDGGVVQEILFCIN